MTTEIWESPRWKELMTGIRDAAKKSVQALEKLDNPLLDPALLTQTRDFLAKRLPQFGSKEIFQLIEGLARKVVPLAETHLEASKEIFKVFLENSEARSSEWIRKNNIEFLRKIVFCLEEPVDTETSLSDEEFRMLERIVNSFSDRLKFNPDRQDLAVREDLIMAAFRKQGLSSGSLQRIMGKVAKFAGLVSKKETVYDIITGNQRLTNFYYFDVGFERFLDDHQLIEKGRDNQGNPIKYLSQDIPVEMLYAFIQGWRAANPEPDVLGEYLINGICSLVAYTILMSLPEGNTNFAGDIHQSQALLADEVCHPIIVAFSRTIAFVIYGDNWLSAIWSSEKKSKYHRSVRYVTVGNIIRLHQGAIVLNNNVMTQYVRNYIIQVSSQA